MRNQITFAWFIACVSLVGGDVRAADVTLKVDAGHPSHAVSARLVGVFFEDINFGAGGGLKGGLVKNGSFGFPRGSRGWAAGVPGETPGESVDIRRDEPAYPTNPHYMRISAGESKDALGVTNEGFRGMGVRAGERYQFSITARANGIDATGVRVWLADQHGADLAAAELAEIKSAWEQRAAVLVPNRTSPKARLAITLTGPATAGVDMLSLCPEKP